MARESFTVRRQKDGTVTFRRGRYVEHISAANGWFDLFERLKFAAITAGLSLTERTLEELFRIAQGIDKE